VPEERLGRAGLIPGSSKLGELSSGECWTLLESHRLGRLAIIVHGQPRIFPVNYVSAEHAIVVRTAPGEKLTYGPGRHACFEIDGYEEAGGRGWSVVANGVLQDITDSDDPTAHRLRDLPVRPQAPGERQHWLALTPDEVTGRSFQVGWVPGHYFG
jgi:nitroimidazol reductase NimA-like FMN-containing flavoprotein (pyridoxamine 5'-phosphate oxidase superfamily)